MCVPQKTRLLERRGFTLLEMLTVITISSGILIVLGVLFRTGLWEVSKSSGRIEMVRNGRNALDNIQRYLSSVMPPAGVLDANNNSLADTRAILWPDDNMIHEPPGSDIPWQQRLQFFTPIDHLSDATPLTARQLVNSPVSFLYEVTAVPGAVEESGQDLILRRLVIPNPWPVGSSADPPPPVGVVDTTVTPRLIGRRLGIPDASVAGGFRDALQVRRLDRGGIQIRVNVTIETISDSTNRNRALNASNESVRNQTNTITMQSIYQPPYFNID